MNVVLRKCVQVLGQRSIIADSGEEGRVHRLGRSAWASAASDTHAPLSANASSYASTISSDGQPVLDGD